MSVICMLYGCNDDMKVKETITFTVNKPILMSADAFRSSVKVKTQPEEITQQGKICFMKVISIFPSREKVSISLITVTPRLRLRLVL